jgi:predicted secreted protein
MGPFTLVAIYLICWWVVLFCVLPLGMQSHHEAGVDAQGGDPGSPVTPNLKRKFITTTWVAAIVWAVVILIIVTGVFPLELFPIR